jgi:hypothetical protein
LTNQDAGDSAAAWLAWWEQNKSKSQEVWIRDGFCKYDIELQTPPTPANIVALLKLAAHTEVENGGAPDYIQYNAFRWLRDSDFDPGKFSANDIPAKDGDRVLQGLLRFATLSSRCPKDDGLGVLKLGKPFDPVGEFDSAPMFVTTKFQILANAIVFVPLCTGVLLIWLSFRMAHRKKLPCSIDC